jgi:hypothetical protein
MDVNFMKMHNPTNPAPQFAGKSRLGRYSDSMLELDWKVGRIAVYPAGCLQGDIGRLVFGIQYRATNELSVQACAGAGCRLWHPAA